MTPPRISVIIPAYGLAHLVGETLASVQAQTMRDWEAIVVDDGSPDDVAGALAPFAEDRRIRLLQTDNRGLPTARNRAIAEARTSYIALLDGDDLFEPTYLERMLEAIEADPALGFVSCDAWEFGRPGQAPTLYSARYPMSGAVTADRVIAGTVHIFVAATVRRQALEDVGGFDAGLNACEDLDLWIRLLTAGWRGAVVPEPLVRYRRRPGSMSSSAVRMRQASCAVYSRARAAATDERARAAAVRQLLACHRELRWLEGETLILRGRPAVGLPMLADAGVRSRRWRLALAVMNGVPPLAPLFLRAARRWTDGDAGAPGEGL